MRKRRANKEKGAPDDSEFTKRGKRYRYWSGTYWVQPQLAEGPPFNGWATQPELCPSTEESEEPRLHWQTYIEFIHPCTLTACLKRTGAKYGEAHIDFSKQDWKHNVDYCSKEDSRHPQDFVPLVWVSSEGWKNKKFSAKNKAGGGGAYGPNACSTVAAKMLMAGKSGDEVMESLPGFYLMNAPKIRSMESYLRSKKKASLGKVEKYVEIHWGPGGLGKTSYAKTEYHGNVYMKQPGNKWWPGYAGEEVVVVNEYWGAEHQFSIDELLIWLDCWEPLWVENKCEHYCSNVRHWVFTSNRDPKEWWKDLKMAGKVHQSSIDAFFDRVAHIIRYDGASKRRPKEVEKVKRTFIGQIPLNMRTERLERHPEESSILDGKESLLFSEDTRSERKRDRMEEMHPEEEEEEDKEEEEAGSEEGEGGETEANDEANN